MARDDVPRPEHPRPQRRREEWRTLNGDWEFEGDPGQSGRERGLPETDGLADDITVPFPPESELSGVGHTDFMPAVWYRREVDIPAPWFDGRLLLHFGAVDYEAEVWIDGESVGQHRGGYTPFSVDITDVATPGTTTITVCAADDVRSGRQPAGKQSAAYDSSGVFYTRVTGIWQSVWLEPVPDVYIDDVEIIPDAENALLRGTIRLGGDMAFHDLDLVVRVRLDDNTVGETTVEIATRSPRFDFEVSPIRRWTPEDPILYDLEFCLQNGEHVVDRVESYTGFRTISMSDDAILLNGEPRFQRLVLDQGYYPDGIYTAPSDEALREDIELAKEMGFDGARLHQKVFEPRFLYWADRLGYLVWGEGPNWGLDLDTSEALARFLPEWTAVIARDSNHPSIVGWCPFNETDQSQVDDVLETVFEQTHHLDPHRLIVDTSGWTHVDVEPDLIDVHDYTQDPDAFAETYAALDDGEETLLDASDLETRVDAPYFISEYGGMSWDPNGAETDAFGHGWPESETSFLDRYRSLTETLLGTERVSAFCYTQLYDIEQEINGLYTYDREPKFDPDTIAEINQQPAEIERN